ncbi:CinA family protein [Acuticoccus sp. MNP-M23]|uniref:CinA family protein n=1 Tax=Acuticoccus sp. MNP-M23 TaxID=3072793 RepID=UPI002815A3F2|nr:CinA family protein [Acuticoccus sp. MNP-M23]WMS42152.1 CinA family protein [Acuticoccus sp. MNP-M23]
MISPFDDELGRRAEAVLDAARARGKMLVTAESCTGGLVAAVLTAIAGSSDAVEGGFITYSNDAKVRLGVPSFVIEQHGAVSEETARAMAEAACAAAYRPGITVAAVSITGVAGPGGGSASKPVGLVHFGASDGTLTLHRAMKFGDIGRGAVRLASVDTALALLLSLLSDPRP